MLASRRSRLVGFTDLGKKPKHVVKTRSCIRQNVKGEAFHVEENVFVINEEFSEQAQALGIELECGCTTSGGTVSRRLELQM